MSNNDDNDALRKGGYYCNSKMNRPYSEAINLKLVIYSKSRGIRHTRCNSTGI